MLRAEPHNLSFAEIADLTDYQIAEIINHARDENGNIDTSKEEPPAMNFKDVVFNIYRLREPHMSTAAMEAKFKKEYPHYG